MIQQKQRANESDTIPTFNESSLIPDKKLLQRFAQAMSKAYVYEHYKYKISVVAKTHEEYQDLISILIERLEF